jgi:hypothetical protein
LWLRVQRWKSLRGEMGMKKIENCWAELKRIKSWDGLRRVAKGWEAAATIERDEARWGEIYRLEFWR